MAKDYHFLCSKTIENAHAGQKNIMASAVFFLKIPIKNDHFLCFQTKFHLREFKKIFDELVDFPPNYL